MPIQSNFVPPIGVCKENVDCPGIHQVCHEEFCICALGFVLGTNGVCEPGKTDTFSFPVYAILFLDSLMRSCQWGAAK